MTRSTLEYSRREEELADYPEQGRDETDHEFLNRLDNEEIINAFQDPDFGQGAAWTKSIRGGNEDDRAVAIAQQATMGRMLEHGTWPGDNRKYQERWGENWAEPAAAFQDLKDAMQIRAQDLMAEGMIGGKTEFIQDGKDLLKHMSNLEQHYLDNRQDAHEFARMEQLACRWDPEGDPDRMARAQLAYLWKQEEMMLGSGIGNWRTTNDLHESVAFQIADHNETETREKITEAVENALGMAYDDGDPRENISHEDAYRVMCIGKTLEDAASRIHDHRDGPARRVRTDLYMPEREGLGENASIRNRGNFESLKRDIGNIQEIQKGVEAVCSSMELNMTNPEWEIARQEREAMEELDEASRTHQGLNSWFNQEHLNFRKSARENDPGSGYGLLRMEMNNSAINIHNEAVNSYNERLKNIEDPAQVWKGLTNHERDLLQHSLTLRGYQEPGMIEGLVREEERKEQRQPPLRV